MTRGLQCVLAAAALTGAAVWLAWPQEETGNARAGTRPGRAMPGSAPHSSAPAQEPAAGPGFLLQAGEERWRDEATRPQLTAALCQSVEQHPERAAALLADVPAEWRPAVQQEAAGALIATHPLEAVKLLDALPQSDTVDQMLRQAAMEYAGQFPEKAAAWALSQDDAGLRALLLSSVLLVQSAHNPRTAAAVALQEMPAGSARDRLLVEIVQRWGQADAPAAAQFVSTLEGPVAADAAANLAAAWGTADKPAAASWIQSLPAGPVQEAAQVVQSSWTAQDPPP